MRNRKRRGWELSEARVTPEGFFLDRRRLIKAVAAVPILAGALSSRVLYAPAARAAQSDPSAGLYPVPQNPRYAVDRPLTDEELATTYNNFYEFGSSKRIWRAARRLPLRPWTVTLDGLVEEPREVSIDDLLKGMKLEERVYRLRCVEAWSMVVPWSGFPLADLVAFARPLSGVRYLEMQTFMDPAVAPRLARFEYPWPYIEGLTLAEATNELAFVATGLYGKPLPPQNGSPLRLVVPWKYGFKSIKSIVRFTFTDRRPRTFWESVSPGEYGFWANVNPEVPHSRWSQAEETPLGASAKLPTRLFNGYAEFVAPLYRGLGNERLYM